MESYNKEKQTFIKLIKNKCILYGYIPLELRDDIDIIEAERKAGMRVLSSRGYDVISHNFFVVENIIDFSDDNILETISITFESFDDYYKFLKGNIYEKSCYFQYQFTPKQIKEYKIDVNKFTNNAIINTTIEEDNYSKELSIIDEEYKISEFKKVKNKLWFNKILNCKNLTEFNKVLANFEKSKYHEYYFKDILIYYFIQNNPKNAFKVLMDSINNGEDLVIKEKMCLYFSPQEVLNTINYKKNVRTSTTISRYMKQIRNFASNIENNNYTKETKCWFDIRTGFYIIEEAYKINGAKWLVTIRKYFYDIKEVIAYLGGDLSNCDLSKAVINKEDIKDCKINENTILPFKNAELSHTINKYYKSEYFWILQKWTDQNENTVHERKNKFKYFFDYLYYLNNDLSNADLIFCDGLSNLKDINGINFDNAHIRSEIMDKLGLHYKKINLPNYLPSFENTIKNEQEIQLVLNENRELWANEAMNDYNSYKMISYVSDIHLDFKYEKCKSKYDVEFLIKDTIKRILSNSTRILLIGGDVSANFDIYKLFVIELSKEARKKNVKVIFILGNHELWCDYNYFYFKDYKLEEIINEYKELIISNNMYFVQNNLLFFENENINSISEEEINNLSQKQIRDKLRKSNLIIFGGLGYSGFNVEFNANNGIYRNTINLEKDIEETKKFLDIYNKIKDCIYDRNVIVLTHTPKKNWSESEEYVKKWVYVNGHTHRNYYYDDGEYRIYSDNQWGYNKFGFIKSFYIEYDYDLFSDYIDGIYTITRNEYIDFYRGKNIMMAYNRDGKIFMLKKKGYYCFIKPSKSGLSILNGGELQSLDINDINYYYENMDSQMDLNNDHLERYSKYQQIISDQVKKIGGSGEIHGSIVDIDSFNHIYVNPFDGTLSGYFAYDIVDKFVFANIPSLLRVKCPKLYDNYRKMLGSNKSNELIVKGQSAKIVLKPTYYPSTDIYKASREIKKMQKLNNDILTIWHTCNRRLLSDIN